MATSVCLDEAPLILKTSMCLAALSKNLTGSLGNPKRNLQKCEKSGCITAKPLGGLQLKPAIRPASPCDDRKWGRIFNGPITVKALATAYLIPAGGSTGGPDGAHRGFHAGEFVWTIVGGTVVGRISGMSNVGTHRPPAFGPCQVCNTPNVMEGRLCGAVQVPADHPLYGSRVMASYRLAVQEKNVIKGVLEGVVILPCF